MPRGLSSEIQAAIAAGVVKPVYLAFFDFAGGALRTWTGSGDLSFDGSTWLGDSLVTSWPIVTESVDLVASNITLRLSGNFGYAFDLTDPDQYRARTCEIYIGFIDGTGALPAANVYKVFSGRMAQLSLSQDAREDAYSLTVESRLVDLAKAKVARYSHQAQLQRFPGDRGLEYAANAQASLFLSRGSAASEPYSRKIIYGETVVEGSVVFVATSGTGSRYLNLVVAFADHACESLEQLYLDDRPVLDGAGAVSGEFVNVVTYQARLGSDSQLVVSELQNEVGTTVWTDDHRLRGITFAYLRILYSEELFGDAAPVVSAKVKGKPLYDPRTGQTVYSDNAALAVRDYLLSENYGFSSGSAEVDDASISVAANDCDLQVARADGTTEKRYTVNGALDTTARIGDNLKILRDAMAGRIAYLGGVFSVYAGTYSLTSQVIEDSALAGDIRAENRNLREAYNGARGLYRTPALGWQEEEYPPYQNASAVAADGEARWIDLPLPLTTSAARCQRIAKIAVMRSRAARSVDLVGMLSLFEIRAGDVLSLATDKTSIGSVAYEVRSVELAMDVLPRLNLSLLEISSADYAFDAATEEVELTVPEEPADSILAWTLARLNAPSATPGSSSFVVGFNATVSHNETGVTVRYTLDGTDPTESDSSIADGGTIAIGTGGNVTLKLKSFQNSGSLTSETVTYEYTYEAPTNQIGAPVGWVSAGKTSVGVYFLSTVNNVTMFTSVNGGSSWTQHNDADDDETKLIATLSQNWTPSNYRAYSTKAGYLDSNQVIIPDKCIAPAVWRENVGSNRWKLHVKVYGSNATLWRRSRRRDGGAWPAWDPWVSLSGFGWGVEYPNTIYVQDDPWDYEWEFYVEQNGWTNSDIVFADLLSTST